MPSWPTLIATENILPFSVVTIASGQGNNKVKIATCTPLQSYDLIYHCGITTGSLSPNSNTYHALAGEAVTLQTGKFVVVRTTTYFNPSGGGSNEFSTVARGLPLYLMPDGNGQVTANPWKTYVTQDPPTASNFKMVALQTIPKSIFVNPITGEYYDKSFSVALPAMIVSNEWNGMVF